MRHVVAGIHFFRALKVHHCARRVLPLEQYLAQQDIWSGRVWLKQQGALQRLLGLGVIASARVSIPQPVIDAAVERVAEALLLKLCDGLIDMFAGERDFAEKRMGERELRVQFQGLCRELLRYGKVLSTEQYSCGQKICRRRI